MVDSNSKGTGTQWSEFQTLTEQYDYIEGVSKQVSKTAAMVDLSGLPDGYGFQFEIKVNDSTENESKPVLEPVILTFGR